MSEAELNLVAVEAAAERLRAGGVVAFPTETVYGLGADALNAAAVREVFRLKGRPAHNPLIVHVRDAEMARGLCRWSDRAERLARAFWPGPLTLVLPKTDAVPGEITAGGDTVAVRAPDHPLATALLMLFGGPLVGPSANRSGHVSPTRAEHVREAFDERDVLVLDGGACGTGLESTVVSLAGPAARVLRPGVIGAEALAAVLEEPVDVAAPGTAPSAAASPLPSPGMLASHYAPRTPAVLVDLDEVDELLETSPPAVVVSHAVTIEPPEDPRHRLIRLPGPAREYAASLYAALRDADTLYADLIVITTPPLRGETSEETAIWRAVHDRLRRATAPRSDRPKA